MFPIATLPDLPFPFFSPRCILRYPHIDAQRKPPFYLSPAQREIIIPSRQTPDTVEVIGEDDNGLYLKRVLMLHPLKCRAQKPDIRIVREKGTPLVRYHGKEIDTTGLFLSNISSHCDLLVTL